MKIDTTSDKFKAIIKELKDKFGVDLSDDSELQHKMLLIYKSGWIIPYDTIDKTFQVTGCHCSKSILLCDLNKALELMDELSTKYEEDHEKLIFARDNFVEETYSYYLGCITKEERKFLQEWEKEHAI